jgi:hypothetical protein
MENHKSLYEFEVLVEREVEKTITTEKDGKTITETTKSKEKVPVYFSFKKPSRAERELAEEERVSWWSRYVEKGILPEALLLKTYANYGGILSEEQKKYYDELQLDLHNTIEDIYQAKALNKDDKEMIDVLTKKMIDLRGKIIDFKQNQSVFFDNTAEAKAKGKLIEFLLLNLSFFKKNKEDNWNMFFKGDNLEQKLEYVESLEESEDELYNLSKDKLGFIAAICASSGSSLKKEEIDEIMSMK